ncbi:hypothetical protein A3K70_04510 [Candidatus Bathyarchaeota archaeon RBG_16_48_13]|nr:MAG: hypothetical protein A3K70_04510 [Candidatus Bathyarchaeota archaeon RBG_16_48_13]
MASVAVDVKPFLVLYLNLSYPLHGILHTLLLSSIMGVALGCAMFMVRGYLHSFYAALRLEEGNGSKLVFFVVAGAAGAMLHVLFDSPLYDDIHPFYPLTANPMYNPLLSPAIYNMCVWMGVLGMIYYAALMILWAHGRVGASNVNSCTPRWEYHGATYEELAETYYLASLTSRWSTMIHAQDCDWEPFKKEAKQMRAYLQKAAKK